MYSHNLIIEMFICMILSIFRKLDRIPEPCSHSRNMVRIPETHVRIPDSWRRLAPFGHAACPRCSSAITPTTANMLLECAGNASRMRSRFRNVEYVIYKCL